MASEAAKNVAARWERTGTPLQVEMLAEEIDAAVAPLVEALQKLCDGFPRIDQCTLGEPYLCVPACKHCVATKKGQKAIEQWRTGR